MPTFNILEIKILASKDKETERDLQEAHLVWEQLQWLFSLGENMLKLTSSMKWD